MSWGFVLGCLRPLLEERSPSKQQPPSRRRPPLKRPLLSLFSRPLSTTLYENSSDPKLQTVSEKFTKNKKTWQKKIQDASLGRPSAFLAPLEINRKWYFVMDSDGKVFIWAKYSSQNTDGNMTPLYVFGNCSLWLGMLRGEDRECWEGALLVGAFSVVHRAPLQHRSYCCSAWRRRDYNCTVVVSYSQNCCTITVFWAEKEGLLLTQ